MCLRVYFLLDFGRFHPQRPECEVVLITPGQPHVFQTDSVRGTVRSPASDPVLVRRGARES